MFRRISTALLLLALAAPALAEPPTTLKKCTGCHGKSLEGKRKAPAIAGLEESAILASLRVGGLKPMTSVAKRLTDEQKAELAKYISALPKQELTPDAEAEPTPAPEPRPSPNN